MVVWWGKTSKTDHQKTINKFSNLALSGHKTCFPCLNAMSLRSLEPRGVLGNSAETWCILVEFCVVAESC